MARLFDKNMFIMLTSIMIGVIIVTYFVADIQRQSQVENLEGQIKVKEGQLLTLEEQNINFTNSFLKSSVLLDVAREDRAAGNVPFDVSMIYYTSALSTTNSTKLDDYKSSILLYCNYAIVNYTNSYNNFNSAIEKFTLTKTYTSYENYLTLLDKYIELCESGARLTLLCNDASMLLIQLSENLTIEDGVLTNMTNVSMLLGSFSTLMGGIAAEEGIYEEIMDEIQEYDIVGFDPYNR